MLEIYYGEIKGTTRLCAGTAIRAALKNRNVLLVSFREDYADYHRLFEIAPQITCMTSQQSANVHDCFENAVRTALTFPYTLLILDGIFDMVGEGKLSAADVYGFLSNAPDNLEVIATGVKVDDKMLELADEAVRMIQETADR